MRYAHGRLIRALPFQNLISLRPTFSDDLSAVIPAQAGIRIVRLGSQWKGSYWNPALLDSRLRENDGGGEAACRKLNVGWFLTQQNRWASGILSGLPTQPIIRVYLPRRQAAFQSEKRPSEYWYSASRSLHTYRVRGCATHPTCELCGTLKPMCRVCAVRTRLLDWRFVVSTFQTASNAVWKHQLQQS